MHVRGRAGAYACVEFAFTRESLFRSFSLYKIHRRRTYPDEIRDVSLHTCAGNVCVRGIMRVSCIDSGRFKKKAEKVAVVSVEMNSNVFNSLIARFGGKRERLAWQVSVCFR